MEGECYFDRKFQCNDTLRSKGLVNIKAKQIQNIIDTIHKKLRPQLDRNSDIVLQAHKEVQKAVKRHAGDTDMSIPAPKKRAKRSEVPKFATLYLLWRKMLS